MRSLDRNRPHGRVFPPDDGAVFEQDGAYFDGVGAYLRPTAGAAPTPKGKPAKGEKPKATAKLDSQSEPDPDGDEKDELVAVEDLGWNDLRKLSSKLGGPAGVGIKRENVLAFLTEDGTTHVPRASLGA